MVDDEYQVGDCFVKEEFSYTYSDPWQSKQAQDSC